MDTSIVSAVSDACEKSWAKIGIYFDMGKVFFINLTITADFEPAHGVRTASSGGKDEIF